MTISSKTDYLLHLSCSGSRILVQNVLKGDRMQIGDKLRSLRKSRGLTTSELADKVSVSQSYISRFENNRAVPDVDMLARILEALGTSIASFFANDDSLPPELDELLKTAKKLTPSQIKAVQHLLDEMVHPQS